MQSVEQLRDRLAELMGWKRLKDLPAFWRRSEGEERDRNTHPVTLSLDWLAAHGLPEGWTWYSIHWQEPIYGHVHVEAMSPSGDHNAVGSQPTELHARLAACVAAWEAQAERSGT